MEVEVRLFNIVIVSTLFLTACEGTGIFLTPEQKVVSKGEETNLFLLPLDLKSSNNTGKESISLKSYPKTVVNACKKPSILVKQKQTEAERIAKASPIFISVATAAFNIILGNGNAAFKKNVEGKINRFNRSYSASRNIEAHRLDANRLKCMGLVRRVTGSDGNLEKVSEVIFSVKKFGNGGLRIEPIYSKVTRLKSSTVKTIEDESSFSLVATVAYDYIGYDKKPVSYKQSFSSKPITMKNERDKYRLTGNMVYDPDPEKAIKWRQNSGITPYLKGQPVSIAISMTEVASGQIGIKEDILKAVDANTKEINAILGTAFKELLAK